MFTKSILLIAISLTISLGSFAQNNSKMKSINHNAPVKCSKTITINASIKKVWAVITNIDNWATWQTEISKPKLNGELKPETTFDWKTGGAKIHSTLHTVEPFKNFGWTGKTFGIFAIHNWTLTETNGQTKVSVDESMDGFFATLLKKSFDKNLEKGMQKWLDLLKQECEKPLLDTIEFSEKKDYQKIVTIVKVKAPWYAANFLITNQFKKLNSLYENVDGLLFKAYSINYNENGKSFGGIYLWQNESKAKSWYSPNWFAEVKRKRNTDPTLDYYRAVSDTSYLPTETNYDKFYKRSFVLLLRNLPSDNIAKYYKKQDGLFRVYHILTDNNKAEGLVMFFFTKHQAIKFVKDNSENNFELFKIPILVKHKE
jgi:uncharacterized protein YndB with AHSA1/START domain